MVNEKKKGICRYCFASTLVEKIELEENDTEHLSHVFVCTPCKKLWNDDGGSELPPHCVLCGGLAKKQFRLPVDVPEEPIVLEFCSVQCMQKKLLKTINEKQVILEKNAKVYAKIRRTLRQLPISEWDFDNRYSLVFND